MTLPDPTPITKRLRNAAGDSDATLHLLHRVGHVELFARQRRRGALDYAAVRGNLYGHGTTPAQALASVRTQLLARVAERHQVLSWQTGLDIGFTPACLTAFCAANHLSHAARISRAELQRLAMAHHAANWPHYARSLHRINIHLPPPP